MNILEEMEKGFEDELLKNFWRDGEWADFSNHYKKRFLTPNQIVYLFNIKLRTFYKKILEERIKEMEDKIDTTAPTEHQPSKFAQLGYNSVLNSLISADKARLEELNNK